MKFIEDITKLQSTNYRAIDQAKVNILIDSIREVGVQNPIDVFEDSASKKQYIISGHHRAEAIKQLQNLSPSIQYRLPANVIRGSNDELQSKLTAVSSVVSNMMVTDMNIIDRAAAFSLLKNKGYTTESIARICGKSARTVQQTLLVDKLPDDVKIHIVSRDIKEAAVYSLASKHGRGSTVSIDMLGQSSSASKKNTRSIRVDPIKLKEKLKSAKIAESTINKVMSCL